MAGRGGILMRTGAEALVFISADEAVQVTALSALTRVAGARAPAVGIALAGGEVVTVLDVGKGDEERGRAAVLCNLGGERVALVGGSVVATGTFEASAEGDGVVWNGAHVPPLDLQALYAQAEAAIWAARAAAGAAS